MYTNDSVNEPFCGLNHIKSLHIRGRFVNITTQFQVKQGVIFMLYFMQRYFCGGTKDYCQTDYFHKITNILYFNV